VTSVPSKKGISTGTWAAVVTLAFWSSAFSGIRIALESYNPLQLTLLRFLVASSVFIVYGIITRIKLPRKEDVPGLFLLSLAGITIYHTTLNLGEVSVPAGTASFIIATAPVFTALISSFALKEKLNSRGWSGFCVSLAGSAVMALGGGTGMQFTKGALLILLSAMCTAVFFVYQKPFFSRYKPIELTAYITWLGTVPLLLFAGGLPGQMVRATANSTLAAVYIGIFPAAIAYASWSIALSKLPATRASSLLYINPLLAMLFGYVLQGEIPHLLQIAGGVVAMAGVVMVNTRNIGLKGAEPAEGDRRPAPLKSASDSVK
jgi:drug/metabolite transporter (DMT)-like permease